MTKQGQELDPAGVPVLWLLGKTGAGKTSLVRALTGEGAVGNGFAPGTRDAALFDFPATGPAVRFLDTRGLGEAGHDSAEDLKAAQGVAHAALAVIRYDDPVQAPVIDAVRATRLPVLLVFTGADLLPSDIAQERVRAGLRKAIGRDLPFVSLALPPEGMVTGLDALLDALDSFMPRAAAALRRADEARSFARLKPLVLRYAAMAGASDVAPVVGMAAVPAAQGALLQALARRHGVSLTPARLSLLASALGTGALVRLVGEERSENYTIHLVANETINAMAAPGLMLSCTYFL